MSKEARDILDKANANENSPDIGVKEVFDQSVEINEESKDTKVEEGIRPGWSNSREYRNWSWVRFNHSARKYKRSK